MSMSYGTLVGAKSEDGSIRKWTNVNNLPVEAILETCREQKISIVCVGRPEFSLFSLLKNAIVLRSLIGRLSRMNIDLFIMS